MIQIGRSLRLRGTAKEEMWSTGVDGEAIYLIANSIQ
jgi:hypothetical protein